MHENMDDKIKKKRNIQIVKFCVCFFLIKNILHDKKYFVKMHLATSVLLKRKSIALTAPWLNKLLT